MTVGPAPIRHIVAVLALADLTIPRPSAVAHGPFVAALAAASDHEAETSARWQATAAGLLVLHVLDLWASDPADLSESWRNVVARVERLPQAESIRALLLAVASAARTPARQGGQSPLVPLTAYARALERDAEWSLAADVYETVIARASDVGAHDLVPSAYERLAYCSRLRGNLDAADRAIQAGRAVARAQRDETADLWLRLSAANLIVHRGNLPAAAAAFEALIADATAAGAFQIAISARHDSGAVAFARGEYERAALLYFSAAEAYEDSDQRARALYDLGTAASALGHRHLARCVNECIFAAAPSREFRWTAAVNLLEQAVLDGSETMFEYYRQSLQDEPLPVSLLANFHLYTGRGYVRFGRLLLARQAFGRVLGVATDASLNQIRHIADGEIEALDRVVVSVPEERRRHPAPTPAPGSWSPAVDDLVRGVDRLKAGMAG